MATAKLIRLILLTGGATFAVGGCASGGWLQWIVGAGSVLWLSQLQA